VTRVLLPIAIESLRRKKFDPDKFLEEAREGLEKGFKKSRPQLEDVKEEVVERAGKLYGEARKQGEELLETLASRGVELAQGLVESVGRPRRRRRFRLVYVFAIAAVAGVGVLLASRR
ncbi:MAG TPA: hypothetical protein VLO07_07320, partial [Thermoanaerobaculia bacterium]|nr:hypothetical protein [Thermoanaerobaculia bacterium]